MSTRLARRTKTHDSPDMAGRKGLSPEKRKSIILKVCVNQDERRTMEKAASKAGEELGTWIRSVALNAATKKKG